MLDETLDVADAPARVALVPGSVELFRCHPELDNEVRGKVLRLGLTAFLAPEASRPVSSAPMMIRASEPPMKARR